MKMKPTKYCQDPVCRYNKVLREKNSPSAHYCKRHYLEYKIRYDKRLENQKDWQNGLRGARMLAGGSFHPCNERDYSLGLSAFFYYVFPEIDDDRRLELVREFSKVENRKYTLIGQDGQPFHIKPAY